MKGKFDLL